MARAAFYDLELSKSVVPGIVRMLHVLRDFDRLMKDCCTRGWLRYILDLDHQYVVRCRVIDTQLKDVAAMLASAAYITGLKDVGILPREFLTGDVTAPIL